jgi:hypothetical protein
MFWLQFAAFDLVLTLELLGPASSLAAQEHDKQQKTPHATIEANYVTFKRIINNDSSGCNSVCRINRVHNLVPGT